MPALVCRLTLRTRAAYGAFSVQGDLIRRETLATAIDRGSADWKERTDLDLDGESISLWIQRESD